MTNWYVLQTKVKQEVIAENNLGNQGFTTFLPMLRVQQHTRGRWGFTNEALFPGYLFIKLDLELQNTASIRSTRGVIRLVRLGATLQPFPESLLQALIQAQTVSGDVIDPSSVIEAGDEVVLISGAMAGLKAIFKARNSKARVVLLLSVLGNQTEVSVSPHDVRKTG